jgi:hypothetical protein
MSSPNTLHLWNSTPPNPNAGSMRREHWREWREVLRRHQLQGIAAWILEAGAPLALLSAQLLYVSGPWIGRGAHRLAQLLESDEETMDFLRYLQSDSQDAQESPPGMT